MFENVVQDEIYRNLFACGAFLCWFAAFAGYGKFLHSTTRRATARITSFETYQGENGDRFLAKLLFCDENGRNIIIEHDFGWPVTVGEERVVVYPAGRSSEAQVNPIRNFLAMICLGLVFAGFAIASNFRVSP